MRIQCDGCHRSILSTEPHECPGESIAFQAGRKARAMGIPLRDSALRNLRPESQQYDDYVDGYDFEKQQRKRKPKSATSDLEWDEAIRESQAREANS